MTASAHSSEHIGKKVVYVSKIPKRYEKVFFVGELLCVRNRDNNIESRTIYYYLMSQDGYKSIQNHVRGVHLIASEARQIPIPLPPLAEQRRIVAKIEELFTRLDAGVEALKKAKEQIKRYRQAVLKYAFEGKLTEEWRVKANQERTNNVVGAIHELPLQNELPQQQPQPSQQLEPASVLLPPVNTSELPELPEGWVWVRLGEVCEFEYGKGLREDKRDSRGNIPVYGSNGIVGYHSNALVNSPCLIIGRKGAVGQVHFSKIPCWPIDTTYFILPYYKYIEILFLFYLLTSLRLEKLDKSTAIPGLNRNDAYNIIIPLPPLPEQQKIVEEIEQRFSVVDEVEKAIDNSLKQAERLRQSILKKAFEGKLVPQDPNDEPAEKLLERIKNRRAESRSRVVV